jgi:hypothetical protein
MCAPDSLKAMACHLGTERNVIPCAGFVVVVGRDSIGLRLAASRGVLRFEDYETDAPLHPSMAAMMAAHPDPAEVVGP